MLAFAYSPLMSKMIWPAGNFGNPCLVNGSKVSASLSCGGFAKEYGAFSPMATVAWMIFLTVFDLPVLVIPNSAVLLPRKSWGWTKTGISGQFDWNRLLEL